MENLQSGVFEVDVYRRAKDMISYAEFFHVLTADEFIQLMAASQSLEQFTSTCRSTNLSGRLFLRGLPEGARSTVDGFACGEDSFGASDSIPRC